MSLLPAAPSGKRRCLQGWPLCSDREPPRPVRELALKILPSRVSGVLLSKVMDGCLSLPPSLSVSQFLSFCLCLSIPLCLSLSLPPCLCFSLSLHLFLRPFVSVSLHLSLFVSLSVSAFLSSISESGELLWTRGLNYKEQQDSGILPTALCLTSILFKT